MAKKLQYLNPSLTKILSEMGTQIKLARRRRNLSMALVCARADISRVTLCAIEKGSPTVSMGAYAKVLHALNGMEKDLLLIAKDDQIGRTMEDIRLLQERSKK